MTTANERPNLILITTDQQRFDTIAALGNRQIFTPHLDWLCDEGIAFTRAYSDCPVCMPARATLMSGRHGHAMNYVQNGPGGYPLADYATMPGLLTAAGYQTRAIGKMHFHPERAHFGFEHMELDHDYHRQHPEALGHGLGLNEIVPGRASTTLADSPPQWIVDRSIDFLETRDPTRPFFLWSSFEEPHPPFTPLPEFADLYADVDMPDPVTGDWQATPGLMHPTWCLSDPERLGADGMRAARRAYYALISQVDYALGRLFGRLRTLGLLANTWIIFTSDHGEMLGDHGMGSKLVQFEGSSHVPMIIRPPSSGWPVPDEWGTRCDHLTSLADIMPTLLARAGVAVPDDIDGVDMMTLPGTTDERVLIGDAMHTQFSITKGTRKLIWCAEGGDSLVFDLAEDPYETRAIDDPAEDLHGHLIRHLEAHSSKLVDNGRLCPRPVTSTRRGAMKCPGFVGFR